MAMPRWRRDQLGDAGRAVRRGKCPGCGDEVYTGLDADLAAFLVQVDAAPVSDPAVEGRVLLAGRWTFFLRRDKYRTVLERRRRWNYGTDYPCYVEHQCQ